MPEWGEFGCVGVLYDLVVSNVFIVAANMWVLFGITTRKCGCLTDIRAVCVVVT